MGRILQEQGLFAEALAELEEDHRLGSARPDWLLKKARLLVEWDAKLPGVLDGSEKPAAARDFCDYAYVCKLKGLNGASARLYAAAFAAEPTLATSPREEYRWTGRLRRRPGRLRTGEGRGGAGRGGTGALAETSARMAARRPGALGGQDGSVVGRPFVCRLRVPKLAARERPGRHP